MAEVLGVLEGDLRDRGDERREHIGGVQAAPQADLDDRDGGRGLEEAGVEPLDVRLELRRPFGERIFADRHTVYGDALARREEMRRRVQADAPALRPELIRHERAGRSFAVGAADVDRGEMAFRPTEHVEQSLGRAETPLDAAGLPGEKKLAGVFESQSAASAGQAPVMCRSSCAAVSRSSPRGTTASIIPWSNRNSAV